MCGASPGSLSHPGSSFLEEESATGKLHFVSIFSIVLILCGFFGRPFDGDSQNS